MPKSSYLITAIGTPLDAAEELHVEGLERHLHDQWSSGIDGILVAGSMGLMQMHRDQTYHDLIKHSVDFSGGRGEVMVGVGDASFARTSNRIQVACRYPIDGVVVLAPYLFRFSQSEMVDYFCSLADISPVPLYLYDLPVRTNVAFDVATYEAVAQHPNIKGAKISGRIDIARELLNRLGDRFRIIVAEPQNLDSLLRDGIRNHLDGIFAVVPEFVVAIAAAAVEENWPRAAFYQARLNSLLHLLRSSRSVMGAFTVLMNAKGIPGNFHALPFPTLNEQEQDTLWAAAKTELSSISIG